jgi:hypothetical protein
MDFKFYLHLVGSLKLKLTALVPNQVTGSSEKNYGKYLNQLVANHQVRKFHVTMEREGS